MYTATCCVGVFTALSGQDHIHELLRFGTENTLLFIKWLLLDSDGICETSSAIYEGLDNDSFSTFTQNGNIHDVPFLKL